jgi:hypothetical protein
MVKPCMTDRACLQWDVMPPQSTVDELIQCVCHTGTGATINMQQLERRKDVMMVKRVTMVKYFIGAEKLFVKLFRGHLPYCCCWIASV